MNYLKLYARFIIIYLKSITEYRFSFFMDLFIQVFSYTVTYIGIWVMLNKFNNINGWNYDEIMFLFNFDLFSYGLCGLFFFSPVRSLEGMVKQGTFDSILIKPMNTFVHLIFRQFNHAFIGHVILGLIVFSLCLGKLNIIWTFAKLFWFVVFIIGAMLIQSALMIITGTLSFWFITSNAIVDTTIYGIRRFINYPITIYSRWVQLILTFIIPYAFVNFYPAQYFFSNKKDVLFHEYLQYGTPIVGIILFLISVALWNLGVNRYQSTGS